MRARVEHVVGQRAEYGVRWEMDQGLAQKQAGGVDPSEKTAACVADVAFDAGDLASGVYIYRITTANGEFNALKKMVLLK